MQLCVYWELNLGSLWKQLELITPELSCSRLWPQSLDESMKWEEWELPCTAHESSWGSSGIICWNVFYKHWNTAQREELSVSSHLKNLGSKNWKIWGLMQLNGMGTTGGATCYRPRMSILPSSQTHWLQQTGVAGHYFICQKSIG